VKRCATVILQYIVLFFMDYLPIWLYSANLPVGTALYDIQQEVLFCQPVKNKKIKVAVCF
jgi:hypothetical protein